MFLWTLQNWKFWQKVIAEDLLRNHYPWSSPNTGVYVLRTILHILNLDILSDEAVLVKGEIRFWPLLGLLIT